MSDAPAISPVVVAPDGQLFTPLVGNPLGFWEGLRLAYLAVRPGTRDPSGVTYPETTHADVARLVDAWARVIHRDHVPDRDAAGFRDRWLAYVAQREGAVRAGHPAARFADNRALWLDRSLDLARGLAAMYRPPTTVGQLAESTKAGLEAAAGAIKAAAWGAGPGALVEHTLGGVGGVLGGGLWRQVRAPLLIGAAVIGAIVIVPRVWPRRASAGGAA